MTMTTAGRAWLETEDRRTTDLIRRHGWRVVFVAGEPAGPCPPGSGCESWWAGPDPAPEPYPAFAYTVGLFGLGHPELLVFALEPEGAAALLEELGRRIKAGKNLRAGRSVRVVGWPRPLVTEQVPNPGAIALAANRSYQRPGLASVPLLQLSYPDVRGRFPWQPGCVGPAARQPRPGEFEA